MNMANTVGPQTFQSSSGRSSIGSFKSKEYLISEVPPAVMQELCRYLDEVNAWQDLVKLMKLRDSEIKSVNHKHSINQSPSEEMLKIWGNIYNHNVTELFVLLFKKTLYPAMHMLKKFVSCKYHLLISVSRPDISELLKPQAENSKSQKLLNCSLGSGSVETTDDNCTPSVESSSTSVGKVTQNLQKSQQESTLLSERSVKEYATSNLEINYEELIEATNNWHDQNILGKGGFGTVYKGYWKHTDVAIKVIHYRAPNGGENIGKVQIQQSLNELKYLNSFRHDNVLPLYGYSIRGEKPCLVYQYMRGGCLDRRLFTKDKAPLTFKERFEISLGTARGINYIHTHTPQKPLIHGDIKPANVLLDQCLMPKIGDFGLAREGPNGVNISIEVQTVFGTRCYLPPEFLNSKKLSTQVDTFSFGVTLLETFTGQRAFVKNRHPQLLTDLFAIYISKPELKFSTLLDPNLKIQTLEEFQICSNILNLALRCTTANAQQRPAMEDVLKLLRNFYQSSESLANDR